MDGIDRKMPSADTPNPGERSRPDGQSTWVRKNATAVMIAVDEAIDRVLGWKPDDLIGKTSLDFIHPDDQTLAVENWMQMLTSPCSVRPVRIRHRHRDGSWIWIEITNRNLLDDPSEGCVLAEMLEVSGEMPPASHGIEQHEEGLDQENRPLQLHEALRQRELLLHRLAEALPIGVLHLDASGRVLYTNRQFHTIIGKERAFHYKDQLLTVAPEDKVLVADAVEAALHDGLDTDIEFRVATSEESGPKEHRQCTMSVRTLVSETGDVTGAVATLADVTESVRMRDELRLQATFDTATGCFNRASTLQALEAMLASSSSPGRPAAIFIDLDDLKSVNDHLGHAAGDEVLEIVGRRLRGAVREGDLVGRIGGDEFLVLCPGVVSAAGALRAGRRVARALHEKLKLSKAELSCHASVGVAWSRQVEIDADTLLGQADAAMYECKRRRNGRPVMFGQLG
jgi:diguanylate cyclase (GGDEF)-like protein/PAS domain S-box-containing protein